MKGAFGPLATHGLPYNRPPAGPPVSSYPQLPGLNPAAMAAMTTNHAAALVASAAAVQNRPPFEGRSIWTRSLRLCDFCAYVEPETGMKNRHELVSINSNEVTHADPLLEVSLILRSWTFLWEYRGCSVQVLTLAM